jgi:hypothetical protein
MQVLRSDPNARAWVERAAADARLGAVLQSLLPAAIVEECRVLDSTGEELVLGVAAGATATRLRTIAPAVLAALAGSGHRYRVVRVIVRPRRGAASGAQGANRRAGQAPHGRRIGGEGVAALGRLASELPPGPLREAVRRLASEHQNEALEQVEDQHRT